MVRFIVAAVLILWTAWAAARELYPGQYAQVPPAVREWFKTQKVPGTSTNCCDISDGVYAEEDIRQGKYWTRFIANNGDKVDWMEVPSEVVLSDGNRNGSPVVWYVTSYGVDGRNTYAIRCYAPGGGF